MDNLYVYAMSKFEFKWVDPKDFDSNKYSSNSSRCCVLEVILNFLKNYINYIMISFSSR